MTKPSASWDGVLIVDKPKGRTSHQVVAEVSRALGRLKAGHAGTLDPMATGVLVVCLGEGTKISGVLTCDDKAYDGELVLGVETDTLDADGQVVRERRQQATAIDRDTLLTAMNRMLGPQDQVPPMYSAVKVGGRRLHQLARSGQEIEREARPIDVRRFELLSFDGATEQTPPRARFHVDCSKGTYVRSLVADLGEALGCGAHLTALRRTRSGHFSIERAVSLDGLTSERAASALLPLGAAVAHLPKVTLSPAHERAARVGQPLRWPDLEAKAPSSGVVALVSATGGLVALCEVVGDKVQYRRVFHST